MSNFIKIRSPTRNLKTPIFSNFSELTSPLPRWPNWGNDYFLFNLVWSLMRLPHFFVLAYLEVPKLAKPGPKTDRQTDRPTEFAIAICYLVNTKWHKNSVCSLPLKFFTSTVPPVISKRAYLVTWKPFHVHCTLSFLNSHIFEVNYVNFQQIVITKCIFAWLMALWRISICMATLS